MRPALSLLAFAVAGCAAIGAVECRNASWYDLGFRDAIFGLQRQEDLYVHLCEPHGAKVDVARYVQGWREGKYEADQRRNESMD